MLHQALIWRSCSYIWITLKKITGDFNASNGRETYLQPVTGHTGRDRGYENQPVASLFNIIYIFYNIASDKTSPSIWRKRQV